MWTKIKLRLTCVYDTPNPQRSLKWTQHIYRSFCGAKLLRLLRASTSRVQMEWTTWNYATSCPFSCFLFEHMVYENHGSLNVPIEHHPTIRYMVYNGYYKVMSNIPKMGQLPTPEKVSTKGITFCGRPGGPGTFCTQWTSSLLPGGGPESQSGI